MLSFTLLFVLCIILNFIFTKNKNTILILNVSSIAIFSLVGLIYSIYNILNNVNISYVVNNGLLPFTFKINIFSSFFLMVIFLTYLISITYSLGYLRYDKNISKIKIHYLNMALLILSMAFVVISDNSISFMLSWELMSISSYILITYYNENIEVRQAALKYFIFTHIGGLFILSAFAIAYGFSGSFDFSSFSQLTDTTKLVVFLLAFVGFASKAGVFPLHIWLPYAHPSAPSHVSAIMSGVMIKMGIFGILKLFFVLNFQNNLIFISSFIIILGILSSVLGVIYALGQNNLKTVLAYSSIENIGIILIGLGLGIFGISQNNNLITIFGFTAALLHLLNHSIFKSLLFLGAGSVIHSTKIKSINKLGGLLKKLKITSYTFLIGSIAISGLPPFNGFIGEIFIYISSFNLLNTSKYQFILIVVLIISLSVVGGLAVAVFTKVFGMVFLGEARSDYIEKSVESSFSMKISMIILAILCVIIGFFPYYIVKFILNVIDKSLEIDTSNIDISFLNNLSVLYLVIALIFFVIWLLRLNKSKNANKEITWSCGYQFPNPKIQYTASSYSSPILNFYSHIAPIKKDKVNINGFFPNKTFYKSQVIDLSEFILENFFVKPFCNIANIFKYIQHGNIQIYIAYILVIIIVLLLMI